ncbi:MAG: flagellar export chaperone FlgN [Lawsonibacter sp.]
MEQTTPYNEYLSLLESLSKTLARLTELSKTKAAAVRRDDLPQLNACINEEQALSLALKGIDQKREVLLAQLGLTGVPLSGLPGHCPPSLLPKTRDIVARLQSQYRIYTAASETARTTLECNLHQIERYLAERSLEQPVEPLKRKTDIRA